MTDSIQALREAAAKAETHASRLTSCRDVPASACNQAWDDALAAVYCLNAAEAEARGMAEAAQYHHERAEALACKHLTSPA